MPQVQRASRKISAGDGHHRQYGYYIDIDIMALDANKLGVASDVLAKALCRMLARIVTDHGRGYQFASVAVPLEDGSNQRRPIIQASRPEREPD